MNLTLAQFGIDHLNAHERIELIELIWDSIPDSTPVLVPDWHRRELARRISAADAAPSAAEPWEEVLARLSENK